MAPSKWKEQEVNYILVIILFASQEKKNKKKNKETLLWTTVNGKLRGLTVRVCDNDQSGRIKTEGEFHRRRREFFLFSVIYTLAG